MKLHASLLQDYEFSLLTDAEKYQLIGLWLLATQLNNKLPDNEKWLCNKIQATRINLSKFKELGFVVQHASNALADCKQSADVETEAETEAEAEAEEKKASRKKPETTAPETFEITKKLTDWSREKSHSINLLLETEKFLNWHRSKGSKYSCWESAWRNWMLKAETFYKKDNPAQNGNKLKELV